MRNRTKKKQSEFEKRIKLLLLISGLFGLYMTGTFKGAGITVGIVIGMIIIFIWIRSVRFNKRMKQSRITDIDQMTGIEFEEYVGMLFKSQGYKVRYTPTTGDYGADLILKNGRDIIVVQAKRYKSSVGIKAVQEVIPAVKMYGANAAYVISNSYYTKAAITLAKHNDVRMIDRDELIQMSFQMGSK